MNPYPVTNIENFQSLADEVGYDVGLCPQLSSDYATSHENGQFNRAMTQLFSQTLMCANQGLYGFEDCCLTFSQDLVSNLSGCSFGHKCFQFHRSHTGLRCLAGHWGSMLSTDV